MNFRRVLPAALAVALLPCASEAALRFPLIDDVQRCITATMGMAAQTGRVRLTLMLRPDGTIYASYVHNSNGFTDRRLERCIANQSTVWTFDPAETAYERPYEIIVQNGVIALPDANNVPARTDLDVSLAQDTLDVQENASPIERARAQVDVHDFGKAIPALRSLQGGEAQAMLARALAESGGDLKEARGLAERSIAAAPGKALGHEALLRVCKAQEDRECMADQWQALIKAADFGPRTLVVKEQLEAPVRVAVCELNAEREKKSLAPCSQLQLQLQQQAAEPEEPVIFASAAEVQAQNQPRRGAQWIGWGGYGMAAMGAGMGAVMGQAILNSTNRTGVYTDHKQAYLTGAIGAVVGLIPGLLFGQVARSEDKEQARSVIVLLDVGGTMACVVAWSLLHTER